MNIFQEAKFNAWGCPRIQKWQNFSVLLVFCKKKFVPFLQFFAICTATETIFFVTFGTVKHCFSFIRLYGVFPGLGRS